MSGTTSPDKGLILMSDSDTAIRKKIMAAVTDTAAQVVFDPQDQPGVSNLLVIYSVLSGADMAHIVETFTGRGYGELKKGVVDLVIEAVAPFRARMTELLADPGELDRTIADGADRARAVAAATMDRVRDALGLLPALRR